MGSTPRARLAVLLALTLLLAGCTSSPPSNGTTPSTQPPPTSLPAFSEIFKPEIQAWENTTMRPEAGGVVELEGARLEVPAGALSETATVGLVAATVPIEGRNASDGSLGGQRSLSDRSFLISTDRAVHLDAPIELVLPIDVSRLPADAGPEDIQLSAVTMGYLIPQGPPARVDLAAGEVILVIDPATFERGLQSTSLDGPLRGAGVSFVLLLVNVAGTVLTRWSFINATVDEFRWMNSYKTTNFWIRYRGEGNIEDYLGHTISFDDVVRIGQVLERAHDYYVDELGFKRPDVPTGWARYPVFLDDFKWHATAWLGLDNLGFTMPGSSLAYGGTWINLRVGDVDSWSITAAHEYLHAVQPGIIEDLQPNLLRKRLDLEANWLFEGTATALSGRLIHGGTTTPSRDTAHATHPVPLESIYNPEANDPADPVQDLFFYLENELGTDAFYPEFFQEIGYVSGDEMEPSVEAVHNVLSDHGLPEGLSTAWIGFVQDLLFEPDRYGGNPVNAASTASFSNQPVTLDRGGVPEVVDWTLPPLSYDYVRFRLPQLITLNDGTPVADQPTDLRVDVDMLETGPRPAVVVQLPSGELHLLEPDPATGQATLNAEDVLEAQGPAFIYVAVINPGLGYRDLLEVQVSLSIKQPGESAICPSTVADPGGAWELASELENGLGLSPTFGEQFGYTCIYRGPGGSPSIYLSVGWTETPLFPEHAACGGELPEIYRRAPTENTLALVTSSGSQAGATASPSTRGQTEIPAGTQDTLEQLVSLAEAHAASCGAETPEPVWPECLESVTVNEVLDEGGSRMLPFTLEEQREREQAGALPWSDFVEEEGIARRVVSCQYVNEEHQNPHRSGRDPYAWSYRMVWVLPDQTGTALNILEEEIRICAQRAEGEWGDWVPGELAWVDLGTFSGGAPSWSTPEGRATVQDHEGILVHGGEQLAPLARDCDAPIPVSTLLSEAGVRTSGVHPHPPPPGGY